MAGSVPVRDHIITSMVAGRQGQNIHFVHFCTASIFRRWVIWLATGGCLGLPQMVGHSRAWNDPTTYSTVSVTGVFMTDAGPTQEERQAARNSSSRSDWEGNPAGIMVLCLSVDSWTEFSVNETEGTRMRHIHLPSR